MVKYSYLQQILEPSKFFKPSKSFQNIHLIERGDSKVFNFQTKFLFFWIVAKYFFIEIFLRLRIAFKYTVCIIEKEQGSPLAPIHQGLKSGKHYLTLLSNFPEIRGSIAQIHCILLATHSTNTTEPMFSPIIPHQLSTLPSSCTLPKHGHLWFLVLHNLVRGHRIFQQRPLTCCFFSSPLLLPVPQHIVTLITRKQEIQSFPSIPIYWGLYQNRPELSENRGC